MWTRRWAKKMVNGWLGRILPRGGRALVLDTAELGTARALKGKTTVFGIDKDMPLAAKRFKVRCIPGWSGACLEEAKGKWDLIFLDYCGTVDGNANFCPANDMEKAEKMLRPGGVLAATFSKRNAKYLLSRCLSLTDLPLRRCFEYCETSAMLTLAWSERPLPPIGPPLGSIVKIRGGHVGRVLDIYVDGVSLEPVGKKGNKFTSKKGAEWDEPFEAIESIREGEPRLKPHKRFVKPKPRPPRRRVPRSFQVGEKVKIREEGVLWEAEVHKRCGLDGHGVVLKFEDGTFQVRLETGGILKSI